MFRDLRRAALANRRTDAISELRVSFGEPVRSLQQETHTPRILRAALQECAVGAQAFSKGLRDFDYDQPCLRERAPTNACRGRPGSRSPHIAKQPGGCTLEVAAPFSRAGGLIPMHRLWLSDALVEGRVVAN